MKKLCGFISDACSVLIYSSLLLGLITLVVYLIFTQLPKNASVNVDLTNFEYINAEVASLFSNTNESKLVLSATNNVQLYLSTDDQSPMRVHTNVGDYYTEKLQLLAEFITDDGFNEHASVEIMSDAEFDASSNVFELSTITEGENQNVVIYNDENTIETQLQEKSTIKMHNSNSTIELTPIGCRLLVQPSSTEVVPINTCIIESDKPVIADLSLVFPDSVYTVSMENKDQNLSAQMIGIDNISMKGTGSIYCYYSAKENEFKMHDQNLFLEADKDKLEVVSQYPSLSIANLNQDTTLNLSGSVRKAHISSYNIIPNFWGWVKESVYLIPSLILTVFGGAISLTIGRRKE